MINNSKRLTDKTRVKYLILSLTFFFALLAWAVTDWDQRYEDVCKVDKMCMRLKTTSGSWVKPKPEIMALLRTPDVQAEIKSASAKYGVSSLAVAGAITAENSMNVGVKDGVQTWLARTMGITGVGSKQFSFGLGQINMSAAREAENYIAALEKRRPRGDSELRDEISDPMGSIRVAAMITRKVQDDYKREGFDISDKPGILATLYNLGKSQEFARKSKQAGRLPRVNYFGLFVEKYSEPISTAAKLGNPVVAKKIDKPVSAPIVKVPKVRPKTATKRSDSEGADGVDEVGEGPSVAGKKYSQQTTFTRNVSLVSAPTYCDSQYTSQDVNSLVQNLGYGTPVGIGLKNKSFTEISRSFDCDTQVWKLVKTEDGAAGWISESELTESSNSQMKAQGIAKCSEGSACETSVQDSVKKEFIEKSKDEKLLYVKPIGGGGKTKVGFDYEDFNCGFNNNQESGYMNSFGNQIFNIPEPVSVGDAIKSNREFDASYNKLLSHMSKVTGLKGADLDSAKNPYAQVLLNYTFQRDITQKCLKSLDSETPYCADSSQAVKDLNQFIEKNLSSIKKNPSIDDVSNLRSKIALSGGSYSYSGGSIYELSKAELENVSVNDVRSNLKQCLDSLKTIEESLNKKSAVITPISDNYRQYLQLSDADTKKFAQQIHVFSRGCQTRVSLYTGKKPKNNCPIPAAVVSRMGLYTNQMVGKLYQENPSAFIQDINMWGANNIGLIDTRKQQKASPFGSPAKEMSSYCAEKTADYIQDLLDKNPCISHVYIPSKWVLKKLNKDNKKVIYRKFESQDRYAIEMGDPACSSK